MRRKNYELDMSQGSILRNILLFTLPLILSNVLQLLYNAADIIVVSRWASSLAMASVGATSSLSNLIVNLYIGFSVGVGVLVSQRYGAKDADGLYRVVHTSVPLGFFLGLAAMILGLAFSRPLLELMGTPEESGVLDGAVLYMRIIFIGVPASAVYNFGAAILRAVGDTKRPLYILAASGIVNVILNLVLVIQFHLGVAGVAIATTVSNYLSAFAILYALIGAEGFYKLCFKEMKLHKEEIAAIAKIGLPAGFQGAVFSLSNSVIQSAVNSFGSEAIAGCAAGGNIEGFVYTAMNAVSQATITAVSQNYGAKNEKRVNHSIFVSAACVIVIGLLLGSLVVVFAKPLLHIYINDSEKAIEYGVTRMCFTCLPYFLCGLMEVLVGALRGLGYSTVPAVNALVGACGFRILWIIFVLPLHKTIQLLFLCWPASWLVTILMHSVYLLAVKKKAMAKLHA